MTRVVAVTSGKAGVGKTHLSLGLALQCASKGLRICLVDADGGDANVVSLLDLAPQQTLRDVIDGSSHLHDILLTSHDIDIIPGSVGCAALADVAPEALQNLAQEFVSLAPYDLIIFDLSANLDALQAMFTAIPEVLMVVTPDSNALTDAYAMVKHLQRQHHKGLLRVIVNQAKSDHQAQHSFEKFREVVRVYQGVELQLLGKVPYAEQITSIIQSQTQFSQDSESSLVLALKELADRFIHAVPGMTAGLSAQQCFAKVNGSESAEVSQALNTPVSEVTAEPDSSEPLQTTMAGINVRLLGLETGMETVLQELQALRSMSNPRSAEPMSAATDRPVQHTRMHRSDLTGNRTITDADTMTRFVRNEQRSTPIDALQLRRVVGRMLMKATPLDATADTDPVKISVDQLHMESGNDFSLRPGRYTRISLYCEQIHKPDSFIEEIFSTCAISGCKVHHLDSQVRYWVTSGRDGCILLDGDDSDRNCVQVYMAAGGNGFLETESVEPVAVPRLRRVTDVVRKAGEVPDRLLGKYPHQRLLIEDGEGGVQEVVRLLRRDRSPLICAFNKADGEDTVGHLRESSP